jgi:2,4-dienoyl-CoA reductase-like NADH-dependent reductase (Old Yellow Enzyme family)/thioredoxin reductase
MHTFEMLFSPIKIGTMEVKNRIVMPAMATSLADKEGRFTEELIAYYAERAEGGAGYITVEHTCVHPSGKAHERMLCLHDHQYMEGFAALAESVHQHGTKLVIQLNHAGRQTLSTITGEQIVAPSAVPCPILKEVPKALSVEEIALLVETFSEAALLAKEAGCDGVEFHMAHGYLLCQFLSPYSNQRQDQYGGSTRNRTRFALEILASARKKVGYDFPIICRISADEMVEGGLRLEEAQTVAQSLVAGGADAIHVSACNYESYAFNMPCYYLEEGCFVHLAAGIKPVINVPTIAVGRIRTPDMAEDILKSGKADLIAMGRALIADPHLPLKALRGATKEIRPCLSCNKCVESISQNRLQCAVNPNVGSELRIKIRSKSVPQKVLVIGGGPGGLEAAKVAREMGKKVRLYEAKPRLGGQVVEASAAPGKNIFQELISYYEHLLPLLGVEIKLNTQCTPEMVQRQRPDYIIIATGSSCCGLEPHQARCNNAMTYEEALNNLDKVGERVVIVGGGPRGAEIADYFATLGRDVTIVELRKKIGMGLPSGIRFHLEKRLRGAQVKFLTRAEVLGITADSIRVRKKGVEQSIDGFDTVILATGRTPNNSLAKELEQLNIPMFIIGDANTPRGIKEAISGGARAARDL